MDVIKLDLVALKEDARKIGIALILGGGLGYFIENVESLEALLLAIIGLAIWLIALLVQE